MNQVEDAYVLSLFYTALGIDAKQIDDIFGYVKQNEEKFLSNDIIQFVYNNIVSMPKNSGMTSKSVVCRLIYIYIANNQDKNDFIIKYLEQNKPDDVYCFFIENPYFAYDLIKCFIKNANTKIKVIDNELYGLQFKFDLTATINWLSDMIRDAFERFYNTVCLNSVGLPFTPPQVFVMGINGYAMLKGNKQLEDDIELLKLHQPFLIRLMYADVFEDLVANNLFNAGNLPVRDVLRKAIESDLFVFPETDDELERLFNHFNYLVLNKEKRLKNRKVFDSSYQDVLKQINPCYMLQESEVNKKR